MKKRGQRKVRTGTVISNKMTGSCIINVERRVKDPLYGKYMSRRTKLLVDDKENKCNVGDIIKVMETRPLSKRKRWRLIEVVKKAELM